MGSKIKQNNSTWPSFHLAHQYLFRQNSQPEKEDWVLNIKKIMRSKFGEFASALILSIAFISNSMTHDENYIIVGGVAIPFIILVDRTLIRKIRIFSLFCIAIYILTIFDFLELDFNIELSKKWIYVLLSSFILVVIIFLSKNFSILLENYTVYLGLINIAFYFYFLIFKSRNLNFEDLLAVSSVCFCFGVIISSLIKSTSDKRSKP